MIKKSIKNEVILPKMHRISRGVMHLEKRNILRFTIIMIFEYIKFPINVIYESRLWRA